jgi:hypothetical protein
MATLRRKAGKKPEVKHTQWKTVRRKSSEKEVAAEKEAKVKSSLPRAGNWVVPPATDEVMNQGILKGHSMEGISPSLQEILYPSSERQAVVIKCTAGSVTDANKAEVEMKLRGAGYTVVFLEYLVNTCVPYIEQLTK